jgi:hypothetical protein
MRAVSRCRLIAQAVQPLQRIGKQAREASCDCFVPRSAAALARPSTPATIHRRTTRWSWGVVQAFRVLCQLSNEADVMRTLQRTRPPFPSLYESTARG